MEKCQNGISYDKGCRCPHCVRIHYQYNQGSYRRKHERHWGAIFPTDRLDPSYSQKIVWDAYSVRGLTFVQMAKATGLNKKTLHWIYHMRQSYVYRWVEDAIRENLDTEWIRIHRDPASLVDRMPYYTIYLRLMAQGWTNVAMKDLLKQYTEYNTGFMDNMARRHTSFLIEWQNAQAIEWLADFIGDDEGPSQRTKLRMQNRGIFPQIHYDESGDLIVNSLLPEQRAIVKRLRSKHDESSRSSYGL